jgi:hypothetical protein
MKRAALVLLCLLGFAAPAAAEPEELAAAPGRIMADAWGGKIVWAQLDPSTGLWELVEWRDGRVRRLRGADAFKEPVRLDLGPGPDGKVVAVYARAGKLFLYDFAKRAERALVEFGAGTLPSIWRGQMVFARREGGESSLWLGKLGTGRLAKLPGGPEGDVSGVVATELRKSRVAYVWSSRTGDRTVTELYDVASPTSRAVLLDRTANGAASSSTFVTPEISGGRVYYGRTTVGSGTGNQLRRVGLKDRKVEAVRSPYSSLVTALWAGGSFLLSRVEPGRDVGVEECGMRGEKPLSQSACRLVRTEPVGGWASIRTRVAH